MNLFELFVKVGVDDQASGALSKITDGLGKGLATAAKVGTAAVGAAAAGITALTTAAVNNYSEYEQLLGGVETLFKNNSDDVREAASQAFQTAGLSANEYMETVTSFSASLLQSLGNDTEAAAEYADRAIVDMADNANKMGTNISMIQNAYQGFAKQNYTMLDNLKLGYGGTQQEMYRLMKDAEKLGAKFNSEVRLTEKGQLIADFADITTAIHVIQTEMGITGTTAKEAGTTIQGSIASMKAAWSNLTVALANDEMNLEFYLNNFVTTLVGDGTETNLGVLGTVLPAVETALGSIAKLIEGAVPKIIEFLPGLVAEIGPSLLSAATSLVGSLVSVLPDLLQSVLSALTAQSASIIQTVLDVLLDVGNSLVENAPLVIDAIAQIIDDVIFWVGEYSSVFGETAVSLIEALVSGILANLPMLLETALLTIEYFSEAIIEALPQLAALSLDLLVALANGIADSLPTLIPAITNVILQIVNTLTDPAQLGVLLNAALMLVLELSKGLIDAIPQLVDAAIQLVMNLIEFILDGDNLTALVSAALEVIMAISDGLLEAIPQLVDAAIQIVQGIIQFILDPENIAMLLQMAFDIVVAIANGLGEAIPELIRGACDLIDSLITEFRNANWAQIGDDIINGIWDGLKRTWESLAQWFTGAWNSLLDGVKGLLGISSPSRVLADIGRNMALGVKVGWNDEFPDVRKEIDGSLTFSSSLARSGAPISGVGSSLYGTTSGVGTVSVVQNIYSEAKTAADLMEEALYQQRKAVLFGV